MTKTIQFSLTMGAKISHFSILNMMMLNDQTTSGTRSFRCFFPVFHCYPSPIRESLFKTIVLERNAKGYDFHSTRGATIWKLSSSPCQATTRMLTQKLFHIIKMQPWGQVKNYSLTVAIRVNASHNWNNMGH